MIPKGNYAIDLTRTQFNHFDDPELGNGWWLPLIPQFETERYGLGIHQDPSWNRKNGKSGTHGCIGLDSVESTRKVYNWIKTYKIASLEVID